MTPVVSRCARGLVLAGLAGLWGCSSGPKLAQNQGLEIVSDLPSSSAISADIAFSPNFSEALFEVVAGEDKGAQRALKRSPTDRFGAHFQLELVGVRTEFLRTEVDGSVAMTAVIDEANNALSLFEPPLVVMPAVLNRNEPFEARSAMRVVDAGNINRQKENGSAARSIEYIGDRLVRTPVGEIHCSMLAITFTADLRLADNVTKTTLYVSPEHGIVATQWSEKLKVLGAITKERGAVSVLTREPN